MKLFSFFFLTNIFCSLTLLLLLFRLYKKVRAYRDRVSNLHREVNVLMAVFQATSRTELEECLSRVQSVCGINTDLSRSSRSGHPQHQQKQQKQLMNELRQLLDSRSAELKTLRAQVGSYRNFARLKYQS